MPLIFNLIKNAEQGGLFGVYFIINCRTRRRRSIIILYFEAQEGSLSYFLKKWHNQGGGLAQISSTRRIGAQ